MGRVGSIFDPARTQLDSVRWMVEGPEIDRQRQLVKSVSGLGSVRSVQRAAGFCKRRWNLQKLSTFAPKTAEISLDLLESLRISPNMVKISWKSAWISLNVAEFHQVWSRSRRNQLGSPRISPYLTKYGRDLAGSPRIWAWSCQSCWICILHQLGRVAQVLRRKPATWPRQRRSRARKPIPDRRERRFELKSSRFVGPANLGQVWIALPYIIISTFQPLLPSKTQNTWKKFLGC